jgi:hypothetical protein
MISYIQLINKVESFCNAHLQVQRFGADFTEQMTNFATKTEQYPIVYMAPVNTIIQDNVHIHTVDIYCWDVIQKNRANIMTILSDTNLILSDMYHYFKDGGDYSIDILDVPAILPLNNGLLDYTAGCVMRINFEIDAYTNCVIPLETIVDTNYIIDDLGNIITDELGNNLIWG